MIQFGQPNRRRVCIIWWGFESLAAIADAEKVVADKHQKQWEKYTMSHNITQKY